MLVLIAAIPEGNLDRGEPGAVGGWVGNPQPGGHVPHPTAALSTALDMGFIFPALFRHRTAISHAFAQIFPFFKRWLKTQLRLGPSQILAELVAQSTHFPSRSVPADMYWSSSV